MLNIVSYFNNLTCQDNSRTVICSYILTEFLTSIYKLKMYQGTWTMEVPRNNTWLDTNGFM